MIDPECLDPKNVLAHLNYLGYRDVSPQQLKEFMHDLKKLIKYEQKLAAQIFVEIPTTNHKPCSKCDCSCAECDYGSDKLSSNESYCESSVSSCPTAATYSRQNDSKFNESSKRSARHTVDFELAQKAHTSFIRPWNLMPKDLSARGKKTLDPVRLYHHYKEIWKFQNIPGENKHSELRWLIRNKMLGQEPHPLVSI